MSESSKRLLAALPEEVYERLHPHPDKIPPRLVKSFTNRVESSTIPISQATLSSMPYAVENRTSTESGVVTMEGIVGIAWFMGERPRLSGSWSLASNWALVKKEFRRAA